MHDAARLIELGSVLLGLAVLARVASRLGIPTIPLYLVAGLAFGEGGVLPLVTTEEFIRLGSEIGLILLLFMLGLEYSARDLISTMRRSARAGLADLVFNFVPGLMFGLILDLGLLPALFLGGITLMSSSGIAAKLLVDQRSIGSPHGRYVMTIAVIEDLAMAVYLPLLGVLVVGGETATRAVSALLAVAGVALLLVLASRIEVGISRLLFSRSDEALLLTILGLAVVVAGIAELTGVSAAVGALLAGIVMSGDAARGARQLLSPLRDVFAALFFLFIGFTIDPASLPPVLLPASILAVIGVATKLASSGGGWSGLEPADRLRAGMTLSARGEFSLAIAGLGVATGLDPRLASLAVAYVMILAVAGPIATRVTDARLARAG